MAAAMRQRHSSNVAILFLFFLAGREPGLEAAKSERNALGKRMLMKQRL